MFKRIKNFIKKDQTEDELSEHILFLDGIIFALTLVILVIEVVKLISAILK